MYDHISYCCKFNRVEINIIIINDDDIDYDHGDGNLDEEAYINGGENLGRDARNFSNDGRNEDIDGSNVYDHVGRINVGEDTGNEAQKWNLLLLSNNLLPITVIGLEKAKITSTTWLMIVQTDNLLH